MQYIIYCDESEDRGRFYSNFYGGALIKAADRQPIEEALNTARDGINGEAKWTKITEQDENAYVEFVTEFFDLIEGGDVKMRVMFTQNIHNTDHLQDEYEEDAKYYKLYYQFIKHAFGLMFCNEDKQNINHLAIYLDDAPDTQEKLDNFKNYLASLSSLPDFFESKIRIDKQDVSEVNSKRHVILQAVDVVMGAIQFRLNEHHRAIPKGKRRRG
ncbi:MAG: DUF3800 domain-containing protein, partial [Rhizobiales bacterium]|nr:DUF3800 domain-containing protein [Hyphomicrobiales bacterium]